VPGCSLALEPVILDAVYTTNGTAQSAIALPDAPPIVGVVFYQQMVPLEIGATGFVAVTATNVLELTVGSF